MAEKKKTSTKSAGATKKPAKTSGQAAGNAAEAKTTDSNGNKEKSVNDFASALAERTGLTKAKAKDFLAQHAELLVEELQRVGSVQLVGVGKLKVATRGERQGRNPSTGEAITIKASKQVKLAGGKAFKDRFNS